MFKQKMARLAAIYAGAMLPALSFAQAVTPESKIGEALTTILALVAVGGAAMIGIALARVGWTVGAKFISRLGARG